MRLVAEPVEDDVEDLLAIGLELHDHRERLRVERRAADERAVDLRLRHELRDVAGAHAAAVLDAHALRDVVVRDLSRASSG